MTILKILLSILVLSLLAACGGAGQQWQWRRHRPHHQRTNRHAGLLRHPRAVALTGRVSALSEIVPLGNLNPQGGHVFPTDHMYLFTAGAAAQTNVVAPANIVIANIQQQTSTGAGLPTVVDYGMTFFPCSDVMMTFAHLTSVTPALLSQAGSFAVRAVRATTSTASATSNATNRWRSRSPRVT